MDHQVKVTLIKSRFGRIPNHQKILESLGLRKINQSKVFSKNPSVMGMINKISYLLKVEENI